MAVAPASTPASVVPLSAMPIRVLLIEDNDADAMITEQMLRQARGLEVDAQRVATMADGERLLATTPFDLVLLDLSLPDSAGVETFQRVVAANGDVPVVVTSASDDEALAMTCVRLGAQDYLVKGEANTESLGRAIRYGMERHRLLLALRGLSLVDDLTGLYNRRGFMTLSDGHVQLARRSQRKFLLLFADLDGLKQINDTHGHKEGDRALVHAGQVLRAAFRHSDVIARLGGDEFAVLALEAAHDTDQVLLDRLQQTLDEFNAESGLPYLLSMTSGVVGFEAQSEQTLEALLARADEQLYARKRGRRSQLTLRAIDDATA